MRSPADDKGRRVTPADDKGRRVTRGVEGHVTRSTSNYNIKQYVVIQATQRERERERERESKLS